MSAVRGSNESELKLCKEKRFYNKSLAFLMALVLYHTQTDNGDVVQLSQGATLGSDNSAIHYTNNAIVVANMEAVSDQVCLRGTSVL